MLDPEFPPGSEHSAHALMMNNTPKAWTYDSELYLVKAGTKYTSSGTITFTLAAGASRPIDFPIIMPDIEGTYKVYLDVYVAGELIAAYQAIEDVVVPAVPGTWECPICPGVTFLTYAELSSHLTAVHPDGFQVGHSITNVTSTSARLGAGSTRACRYVFWIRNPDGTGRKVGERTTYSTAEFWVTATGLVPDTYYDSIVLGIDSSGRVARAAGSFITLP